MTDCSYASSPTLSRPLGLTLLLCGGILLGLAGCDSTQSEDRVGGSGQAPVFSIAPSQFDYGFTHIGTPQTRTFSIVNDGEAPPDSVEEDGTLEGDVELTGPNLDRFSIEGGGSYTLDPGDTLDVVVEFSPVEDQTQSEAQLTISHNGDDQQSPFLVSLSGEGVQFEGGSGTSSDPYEITRPDQLQVIDSGLRDAHFVQVGDVDASVTAEWNEDKGFIPIGHRTDGDRFVGTFDGAGYTISNLQIQRADSNGVGLFAAVGETTIQNVVLRDASIAGGTQVGGVVGQNAGGTVRGVEVNGSIDGNVSVGGVAGVSVEDATVVLAETDATVNGAALVGGAVGRNVESTLQNSTVKGVVEGTGAPGQVGGLIGRNVRGEIVRSLVAADVSSSGERGQVGGLVGRNTNGVIRASEYSEGTVDGQVSVGGLVGANFGGGEVRTSTAAGTVTSEDRGGGLVGRNAIESLILNSGATASVESDRNAGGLVGLNRDSVRGCWAEGPVQGDTNVGGLVGANLGTVQASYAQGDVNGGTRAGGLVGRSNEGVLRQSYAVGTVSGSAPVGGLVGRQKGGAVAVSYWNTDATGQSSAAGTQEKTTIDAGGLSKAEMTGTAAPENMEGFDFDGTWTVVADDYPVLQWE